MTGTALSSRFNRRRLTRAVAIYAGVPYLVVTLGLVAFQRHLLYPATRVDRIPVPRVPRGELSEIAYSTHDGLTLRGWRLRHGDESAILTTTSSRARPLALCFPGNAEDRRSRLGELQEFHLLGFDVLLCDYRGYGDNPGSPAESNLHCDALSLWTLAVDQFGYRPDEILLFGESLGGAIAIHLAVDRCAAGTPPAGLVVSSTFDSLPSVVADKYPAFPFRWLLLDTYRSDLAIRDVTCPVTIIHGTDDDLTPIEHARRLFAAAPATSAAGVPRNFIELLGRGHNDLPSDALARAIADQQ